MQTPPLLFDRPALDLHRARAAKAPALFLQEAVALSIEERLESVNRVFTSPAIITGWPQVWQGRMAAKIVRDDDVLALERGAHDLVIHMLSLHWANDPVGQLVQARLALKPDGMLICVLFGGQTLHELRAALAEAESRMTGGLSPRVAPMGEIRDLGGLLQRAGLSLPVADAETLTVSYATPRALMHDLRAMGEANAMASRLRRPTARRVINAAEAIYADHFGKPDGRIPATFEIVTLTGWAPDASQQQPLRPGSALASLADALGSQEHKLNDRQD